MIKRLTLFAVGVTFSLNLLAETLYVFVPTEVRANVMQEKMSASCPGVEVTVFGRSKDFHKQVETTPPNAILSLLPVVESSAAFKTTLRGSRSGANDEDYVLVSVNAAIDLKAVENKKIGVVDLLGRKQMQDFVTQLFQTSVKLTRVTKVEDLLPLLTFGSVDGVFVSNAMFEQIKSKSNLSLVATKLPMKIGLVSAALNSPDAKDKITKCVNAFDSELNSTLGVDKWNAL